MFNLALNRLQQNYNRKTREDAKGFNIFIERYFAFGQWQYVSHMRLYRYTVCMISASYYLLVVLTIFEN